MLRVAIISFPGTNNEVESVRAIKRAGMQAVPFKWNDDIKKLKSCDGYFLVGGFSYEDRGRSGMVAARDPVMHVLRAEAARGKPVIGHCNGAQILVESGLIPLGGRLDMSLARNATREGESWRAPGFLNEWVWITRPCKKNRCATSAWDGTLHIPIAHGEGRYVTNDPALIDELKKNDQIAFQYCDATGAVAESPEVTPNGSTLAIAGICNPEGNVVALMPHPERSESADAYFASLRMWMESHAVTAGQEPIRRGSDAVILRRRQPMQTEVFIATIITNNEERTVEAAAKRVSPSLRLKQYRYLAPTLALPDVLSSLQLFNPNKEVAYVRADGKFHRWNPRTKDIEPMAEAVLSGIPLLRTDLPDTGSAGLGEGSSTGICYDVSGVSDEQISSSALLEVFANPHASVLERLPA